LRSAAGYRSADQFRGLRRQMAGDAYIEPVVKDGGQINDFCGHGSFSTTFSCSSPRVFAVAKEVIKIAMTDFNIC
jgi:hypothetical protein